MGGLQWALELPAGIVWVHVTLATLTWVAMLWTVASAGLLEPGGAGREADDAAGDDGSRRPVPARPSSPAARSAAPD